ncbi:MAG: hypothetical protein Q9159_004285 [Coniocarpon cinnabarinum]
MIRLPTSQRLLTTSLRPSFVSRSQTLRSGCRALATTVNSTANSQQPESASTGAGQKRHQTHAVSNPTLANIEKRWENMPPQEQAELWMALRDRMTVDWHDMTMQEKRASFGPHGPRAQRPPGERWEVFRLVVYCIAGSLAVFVAIRQFARPPPKTMSKEWQEMTNEYMKAQGTEAITGVSSEGYEGKGMVQSPSRPDAMKSEDDD